MFQGGYSTVTAAIGNVLHTLMTHPEATEFFRNGAPLETGVAELIRYDGPVQGTSRIAMSPCVIGGQQLSSGEMVVTLFAAANHDPDQFDKPAILDLLRSPNQHLGYGWGTHSCIGTTAAQATLRGLVGAIANHPASLHSAGPAVRRKTATMRLFDTLPAALSA
jgi:cytochrome P450